METKATPEFEEQLKNLFGRLERVEDALELGTVAKKLQQDTFEPAWTHYSHREPLQGFAVWMMPLGTLLTTNGIEQPLVMYAIAEGVKWLITIDSS